ncbi:hypothetical protein ACF1BE_14260 [Streptomyces sp. NPDC014991]|uniref:hypothetical protein n=1 Tax=Streptomyces sp. NPDC014991 TaxID=3364935 RepID=UPI0036F96ACA
MTSSGRRCRCRTSRPSCRTPWRTTLFAPAEDAPAAALRAVAAPDRLTRRAGREAARVIEEDPDRRRESLGRAPGVGADRAPSLVTPYLPLR